MEWLVWFYVHFAFSRVAVVKVSIAFASVTEITDTRLMQQTDKPTKTTTTTNQTNKQETNNKQMKRSELLILCQFWMFDSGRLGCHCFWCPKLGTSSVLLTYTETIRTGSTRRPHRLSHCSWALTARHVQVQCCFTSTETISTTRDGAISTFTELLNSDSEVWWWSRASCPRMSSDTLGTNCDHCRSMVQCCSFTSTETVRLIRTESPGRPLWLSHSSWTMSSVLMMM